MPSRFVQPGGNEMHRSPPGVVARRWSAGLKTRGYVRRDAPHEGDGGDAWGEAPVVAVTS